MSFIIIKVYRFSGPFGELFWGNKRAQFPLDRRKNPSSAKRNELLTEQTTLEQFKHPRQIQRDKKLPKSFKNIDQSYSNTSSRKPKPSPKILLQKPNHRQLRGREQRQIRSTHKDSNSFHSERNSRRATSQTRSVEQVRN